MSKYTAVASINQKIMRSDAGWKTQKFLKANHRPGGGRVFNPFRTENSDLGVDRRWSDIRGAVRSAMIASNALYILSA